MFICKLEARGIGSGGQEDNGQLRVNVCVCVCVREREREREKGQRIMLLVLLCGWTRGNTSCARLDQNLIRNLVSQFVGRIRPHASTCEIQKKRNETKRQQIETNKKDL